MLNFYPFETTVFTTLFLWKYHAPKTIERFDFLDQICSKSVFLALKRTIEHYHHIQHIRISLGTKFHLNQVILPFGINLPKMSNSSPKEKI